MKTKAPATTDITESELLDEIIQILKNVDAPLLIMKLGHTLQFRTGNANISSFIRERFGGLLTLINKHTDIFTVTGIVRST